MLNARVAQDQDNYNERYNELAAEYDRLNAEVGSLEQQIEGKKAQRRRIEEFIRTLETAGREFAEVYWCTMVEKVTVFKDKMVFTLVTGAEVEA